MRRSLLLLALIPALLVALACGRGDTQSGLSAASTAQATVTPSTAPLAKSDNPPLGRQTSPNRNVS